MLVDSTSNSAAGGVAGAIRQAAGTTGANFQYLLATAQIESGLNPSSKASTSSATGLFQFIDQTWLATMKDAGASLGYGKYADAITRSKSGRLTVSDPAMRAEIMNLRKDPTANALMAGAFTKQNAAWLKTKIGRDPTDGELYMAHFLGAGGASKLIKAAAQNPDTKAADLFPRAARSNNGIFYDKQGNARTVSQVYGVLSSKLVVASAKTSFSPQTADAVAVPPINVAQVTAPTPPAATSAPVPAPAGTVAALDAPISVRTIRIRPPAAPATVPSTPATATTTPAPTTSTAPPSAPSAIPTYVPDPASGSVFNDLFRNDGRHGVSATVSALWGTPQNPDDVAPSPVPARAPAAAPPSVADPVPPPPAAPLSLFGTGHPQRPLVDRRS